MSFISGAFSKTMQKGGSVLNTELFAEGSKSFMNSAIAGGIYGGLGGLSDVLANNDPNRNDLATIGKAAAVGAALALPFTGLGKAYTVGVKDMLSNGKLKSGVEHPIDEFSWSALKHGTKNYNQLKNIL